MTSIVLAAGLSSRMGRNKLLLPYKGKAVVCHVVERAQEATDRVIVVVGHEKEKVMEALRGYAVDFVFNPEYEKGQKTSIMQGITCVSNDDFLIVPGDLPLIEAQDFVAVDKALSEAQSSRCVHKDIPGHPVAFRKENRERLLAHPGSMKEYLMEVGCTRTEGSIGTVFDVDTPERYEALTTSDDDVIVLYDSLN